MMRRLLLSMFATTAILALFAQTQVGLTTYDLQTNTTVCRRVAANAAGQVAITYTRSHTFTEDANDRGTGYNFWNGSAWSSTTFNNTTPGTFNRFDVGRTGWPNAAFLRSGREIIVSHFAGTQANFGGIQVQYRNTPGTGAWTTVSLNSPADIDCTWPRIANSGDSVLIISSAQIGTFFNGVDGGIYLHRSFDGGATWQPVTSIPQISEENFIQLGADVYAVDANDNGVVAMVVGRYQVNLLKSTDFGATWTMTPIVPTFDINGNPNPSNFSATFGETLDTLDLADEAYSVVVDDNGLTHVWYGRQQFYKDDPGTEGAFFFPFQTGLVYWNENLDEPKLLHQTRIPAETLADCAALYSQDANVTNLYRGSFTSQPSGGFDAAGNLYVAYVGMRGANNATNATNMYTGNGALLHYRDVYMMKSTDGGNTWVGPLNVSNVPNREAVYPGIPRKIFTSFIPLIWQEDSIPGNALQAPTGHIHPYLVNRIQFVPVDPASIVNPVDITCPTLDLVAGNELTFVQGCFPEADILANFFNIDDVPQGPDFTMLRNNLPANAANTPGVYANTKFWAEDAAGNLSDSIDVIVTVTIDNVPPVVTLIGLDTLSNIIGTTYTDPGIEINDNGCQPSSAPVIVDNVNNGGPYAPGTITSYQYVVTDNAGNTTTKTRYVRHITTDNIAPVLTRNGNATITLEACTPWVDPGATAFDDVDFDLTGAIVVAGDVVDEFTEGTYVITYSVSDGAGNSSSISRTVIVEDNTAPTLTINDEVGGNWFIYNGDPYVGPPVSASDCVDPSPSLTNNAGTVVNTNVNGTYVVTYRAEDIAGNQNTATTNVIVGVEPTADFEITQIGNTVIVTNTSTNNPNFWRWNYGNGQIFLGQNPPSPTYTTAGTYEICLTVRNRFNDAPFNKPESVECKSVTIVTSIADRNKLDANVEVFPNPSNGLVNVNISDIVSDKLVVSVTNIVGEKVAEEVLTNVTGGSNVSFNLAKKAAGMYFVTISTGSASVTKKVVLQ